MRAFRRIGVAMLFVGVVFGASWISSGFLRAQVKIEVPQAMPVQFPVQQPGFPIGQPASPVSDQFSAIRLHEDSKMRKAIEVAHDCFKDGAWDIAIEALQKVLDHKDDHYVKVRDQNKYGQEIIRWASVKYEANKLLAKLPQDGLRIYEVQYGAKAQTLLNEAVKIGDIDQLGVVAQRYLHTKAGIEANDLLATYFLDRGQFFMASLRFEQLLKMGPDRVKIDNLALFKATLAFQRAGDDVKAKQYWEQLLPRLKITGGLAVNGQVIPIDTLENMLKETVVAHNISPFDWPMIHGNVSNSAQATGSPPLLDSVLWKRPTLADKKYSGGLEKGEQTRTLITSLISELKQSEANYPVGSGFFPIVAGNMMIYRSYLDVRAVFLKETEIEGEKFKPGEIAWKSVELGTGLASLMENPAGAGQLNNWLAQYRLPQYRTFLYDNSLLGTLASDHQLVYAIGDLAIPVPSNFLQVNMFNGGSFFPGQTKRWAMGNTLHAFELETGKAAWQLGTYEDDEDPFYQSHFLGVPISVGGKLYVLNEKNNGAQGDADLRLVCLDPTKTKRNHKPTIVAIQDLGTVQNAHRITHDMTRRTNGVHLAYGEGILVCPTHAGEVLGIDLMTRSLAWAYPYREDVDDNIGGIVGQPPFGGVRNQPYVKMSNWKTSPPVIQNGKVVFTAPDAKAVHCISLRDGKPTWRAKQVPDSDLFLAGVFDGVVVIAGKNSCRGLRLEDGLQIWHTDTADVPSGQGVASKGVYYLPLAKGEICAIDIRTGDIVSRSRSKQAGAPAPGNLVLYEGVVLSQTPTEITAFPQLKSMLAKVDLSVKNNPNDAQLRFNRGELLLSDGQLEKAISDFHAVLQSNPPGILAGTTRNRLHEALAGLFKRDFNGVYQRHLDEYRTLCLAPEDQTEKERRLSAYYRVVGEGYEQLGQLVKAFQMYQQFAGLSIHKVGGVKSIGGVSTRVPPDVWLRRRISGMMANAKPSLREPLEMQIEQDWRKVKDQDDADKIRKFVNMFDTPFQVGREGRLRLAEVLIAKNLRKDFLEAEMALRQLRVNPFRGDPKLGGKALAMLAKLERRKGNAQAMKLAADYYRQLAKEFPDQELIDGKTGRQLLNELATDKTILPYLGNEGVLWQQANFAAIERQYDAPAPELQGFMFHPKGDLTPLTRRYRLVVDASNSGNPPLRLIDFASNKVLMQQPIGTIQNNYRFYSFLYQQLQLKSQYNPNIPHRFFHVHGHLGVVQIGTTVFGVDLDNPRVLWQFDLFFGKEYSQSQYTVSFELNDDDELMMMVRNNITGRRDNFRVGSIGAVQASYVALVTQKGLVVVDPLKGSTMWTRMGVDPQAQVFGDADTIYVVDVGNGDVRGVRALRASDGANVKVRDFGYLYQNRIRVSGRNILAAVKGPGNVMLRYYDAKLGKDLWNQKFQAGSTVLQTDDPNLTGVVEPNGRIIVVRVSTGEVLMNSTVLQGRIKLLDIANLREPLLLADKDRFYVALNQPVNRNDVAGGVIGNNFGNGLRCGLVNGWFLALHRNAGERKVDGEAVQWKKGDIAWHTLVPVTNQMIVLEQFDRLPLIVFSSYYNQMINGGAGGTRSSFHTQSIHKQSGKFIYDPGVQSSGHGAARYVTFQVDAKHRAVNMVGFGTMLQHFVDDGKGPPPIKSGQTGAKRPIIGNPYTPVPPGVMLPGLPGGLNGPRVVVPFNPPRLIAPKAPPQIRFIPK